MIDAIELRNRVRFVLSAAPADTTLNEEFLLAGVNRFFPEPVRADQLMTALNWNQARGWVDKRWNLDLERSEWLLTRAGRTKEGLA